jgi:hypothetical protein
MDAVGTIIPVCGVALPTGHVPADDVGHANAELILKAVNSHAALVEALEWNQRALKAVLESKPFRNVDEAISAAEAALALAKGGK